MESHVALHGLGLVQFAFSEHAFLQVVYERNVALGGSPPTPRRKQEPELLLERELIEALLTSVIRPNRLQVEAMWTINRRRLLRLLGLGLQLGCVGRPPHRTATHLSNT